MKGVKGLGLFVALSLILSVSTLAWAQEPAKVALTNDDCIKCHAKPPADLTEKGGAHKSVNCIGCHSSHRPASKNNIPQCNQCHMGKKHFELKGCLTCHTNPHTPLNINIAANTTDPCLSCHTQQITQLRDNKNKHTPFACSFCHNVHRQAPECTKCHKPHSPDMASAECKKCHKAHMPKIVTYASDISSKNCAACHKKAADLLSSSTAKHKSFECAFCHQAKHKMIPECKNCHSGIAHPAGILAKFPKCSECHNIAHDLNRWTIPARKEAPKEIKKHQ